MRQISSGGAVLHAEVQRRQERRLGEEVTGPQFLARHRGIATPQIAWFQNPASSCPKSPGLLQLPLAATWGGTDAGIEIGVVHHASLCPSARNLPTKLRGLALHSGGHLPFARPPSSAFHRPARAARGQGTMRAAEAASRDAFAAADGDICSSHRVGSSA